MGEPGRVNHQGAGVATTVGVPPGIERAGIVLDTVAVAVSTNGGAGIVMTAVLVALGTILACSVVLGAGAGVHVRVASESVATGVDTDRRPEFVASPTARFGETDTTHSWPRAASVAVNENVPVNDVVVDPGLTGSKVTVSFGGQSAPSTTTGHGDLSRPGAASSQKASAT